MILRDGDLWKRMRAHKAQSSETKKRSRCVWLAVRIYIMNLYPESCGGVKGLDVTQKMSHVGSRICVYIHIAVVKLEAYLQSLLPQPIPAQALPASCGNSPFFKSVQIWTVFLTDDSDGPFGSRESSQYSLPPPCSSNTWLRLKGRCARGCIEVARPCQTWHDLKNRVTIILLKFFLARFWA